MANADVVTKSDSVAKAPDAWHALLRDRSVQFNFPDAGPITPPPNWLTRLVHFLRAHGHAIEIGAWVFLALIVLVAGYFLLRWLARRGLAQANVPEAHVLPVWQPSPQEARLLLQDADALAQHGRFAEAVHLLLLVSIQEIGERRPGVLAPALTSREIAQLPLLAPMARRIFSEIALVVEHSIFGARLLGAAEFAQCRTAFEQFTVPDVWQAAA